MHLGTCLMAVRKEFLHLQWNNVKKRLKCYDGEQLN